MIKFKEHNANPKNKKTSDCVIRALSLVSERPYVEVYRELVEISIKTGYMINEKRCYEKWLEANGFLKKPQPRQYDNSKYTIGEFDDCNELWYKQRCVVSCAHHLTAVVNGVVLDTWDCREKTIGNYYVKCN